MSSLSETATAFLQIITSDDTAEIFVVDENLEVIKRGLGRNWGAQLPLGIYKTKVRSGSQIEERLVVLSEPGGNVLQEFSPVHFASAAPLNNTSQTHEFHIANAETHSRVVHQKIGSGCMIYIFVRDWTTKHRPIIKPDSKNPARGLTLHSESGDLLIDFEQVSVKQDGWDPWAACNIKLDAGCYRLRLEIADGTQIEQTIVASPQWQTQVFLLQRDYDERGGDRRADLAGASILMCPVKKKGGGKSYGFSAADSSFRLDELARLGLARGRQVLSERIREDLLLGKYKNPMLGIYGAHLLLGDKEININLLSEVIENLRRLLVIPHPDVEALALKLESGKNNYSFNLPPMLRRSWAIVVAATGEQPSLVPENSLAARVSTKLWGPEPLLLWINRESKSEEDNKEVRAESLSDFEVVLKEQLKFLKDASIPASEREAQAEQNAERNASFETEIRGSSRYMDEPKMAETMEEAESIEFGFDRTTAEEITRDEINFDVGTSYMIDPEVTESKLDKMPKIVLGGVNPNSFDRQAEDINFDGGTSYMINPEVTESDLDETPNVVLSEPNPISKDDLIPQLVQSLGIPRIAVEKMLKRIENNDL